MNSKETLFWNNKRVEKMKKKISLFELDEDAVSRKKNCECKYCTYINSDRIAGQAFTHAICKTCGKEMIFPSTDTDLYCVECAKKMNICKHCGSEMD